MSDANVDRKASEDDLKVVQSFYDSLDRGDVPGVLALLDPQVRWTEAEGFPYYSGTWVGPDAVLNNLLKRVAEDWSSFGARSERMLVDGPTIVSLGVYTGTHKVTGKNMRAEFAHLWTVDRQKITSFKMYADTAKVIEAMRI